MKAINCPHRDRENYCFGLCKSCYNIILFNFYPGHKEKARKLRNEWRKKHKDYYNEQSRKIRASGYYKTPKWRKYFLDYQMELYRKEKQWKQLRKNNPIV